MKRLLLILGLFAFCQAQASGIYSCAAQLNDSIAGLNSTIYNATRACSTAATEVRNITRDVGSLATFQTNENLSYLADRDKKLADAVTLLSQVNNDQASKMKPLLERMKSSRDKSAARAIFPDKAADEFIEASNCLHRNSLQPYVTEASKAASVYGNNRFSSGLFQSLYSSVIGYSQGTVNYFYNVSMPRSFTDCAVGLTGVCTVLGAKTILSRDSSPAVQGICAGFGCLSAIYLFRGYQVAHAQQVIDKNCSSVGLKTENLKLREVARAHEANNQNLIRQRNRLEKNNKKLHKDLKFEQREFKSALKRVAHDFDVQNAENSRLKVKINKQVATNAAMRAAMQTTGSERLFAVCASAAQSSVALPATGESLGSSGHSSLQHMISPAQATVNDCQLVLYPKSMSAAQTTSSVASSMIIQLPVNSPVRSSLVVSPSSSFSRINSGRQSTVSEISTIFDQSPTSSSIVSSRVLAKPKVDNHALAIAVDAAMSSAQGCKPLVILPFQSINCSVRNGNSSSASSSFNLGSIMICNLYQQQSFARRSAGVILKGAKRL